MIKHLFARAFILAISTSLVIPATGGAQKRVEIKGGWSEVFRVDEEHGKLLLKPELLALGRESVAVFDYGDMRLSTFSLGGKSLWTAGKSGAGPGEFAGPLDMSFDASDAIYVLDRVNSRITIFGATGQYRKSLRLDRQLHRFALLSNGSFVATPLADQLVIIFNSSGMQIAALGLTPELQSLSFLLRANKLLLAGPSEALIMHDWSSRMLVVRLTDMRVVRSGELLNVQAFPEIKTFKFPQGVASRVDPAAKRVVRAAALAGDTLFVVDSREPADRQLIDAYLVRNLSYASSRRAPAHLRSFVMKGDLLIGLVDEPLPALVGWRWKK